jgi:hypothetical protein
MSVDDQISCHGEQPGPYGTAVQRGRMSPGTEQCLLDHVLGLMTVTVGQPEDVSQEWSAVLGVQGAQQALVRSGSHTSITYKMRRRFTRCPPFSERSKKRGAEPPRISAR